MVKHRSSNALLSTAGCQPAVKSREPGIQGYLYKMREAHITPSGEFSLSTLREKEQILR